MTILTGTLNPLRISQALNDDVNRKNPIHENVSRRHSRTMSGGILIPLRNRETVNGSVNRCSNPLGK